MSFHQRLLIVFPLAVVLPMIVLALFIRHEMTGRLTRQYEKRVEALVTMIEEELKADQTAIASSLALVRARAIEDNRLRRATVDRSPDERRYLIDYAAGAMQLTGLSMLQIQDRGGRIVSSGHFRNEYDRLDPGLTRLLRSLGGAAALVRMRAPDAPFLAVAGIDSFDIAGEHFTLVGGREVDARFLRNLTRAAEMRVSLHVPERAAQDSRADGVGVGEDAGTSTGTGAVEGNVAHASDAGATAGTSKDRPDVIARDLSVPFIDLDRARVTTATLEVTHDLDELYGLRRSVDHWFAGVVTAAALLSVMLVGWLASRISRPLVALAEKTSHIDLDRLDVEFDGGSDDEVGVLSRMLGAMTDRLRNSARLIKDAERRATLGELARQVNHDIKNGLTPIRNVLRHLAELAGSDDPALSKVFRERQSTLDSSVAYLENLATNYARLSTPRRRLPCDVNAVAARVVRDATATAGTVGARVRLALAGDASVFGDELTLRRVLENLVSNAIDSLESREEGEVSVATEVADVDGDRVVRVTVADNGSGMSEDERSRIFEDFYTTKEHGTGLGLSIVRRLVMDLDGTIRVESKPGLGSRFVIDFPSADSHHSTERKD